MSISKKIVSIQKQSSMKKLFFLILAQILCLGNLSAHASEVHFSEIDKFIINQIDSAKRSVHVCVFIYEWQPIADALIRASQRGLEVEILTDYRSVNLTNRGGKCEGQQLAIRQKMALKPMYGIGGQKMQLCTINLS